MQENFADSPLGTVKGLDLIFSPLTFIGSLSPLNTLDYYSFTLNSYSSVNLALSGLSADADMELLNSNGEVLQTSPQSGTNPESLFTTLNAGSYYIKVYSGAETATDYRLSLSATTNQHAILPQNSDAIKDLGNPKFETGVFTVGSSGQVSIDYLFDGGAYQGELAIFSLEGMEQFDADLNKFITEAARRALSDSQLGHLVISDSTQGARFHGSFSWEGDFNSGDYLDVKTFSMRPGDTFGVMLVPNGTVQGILDNPTPPYQGGATGGLRPLFSLSTKNPNEAFHVGQIADVTGDGNTFVMEDLRVDQGSDKDYNDIIFQVRGATGSAVSLDEVIDSTHDWRSTDLGQALTAYAQPYITPNAIEPIENPDAVTISIEDPEDTIIPIVDTGDAVPVLENATPTESIANTSEIPEPARFEFPKSDQPLVGIIDTGFSANNPYIDYSRITLGEDRIDGDTNPLLQPGEGIEHGTHILGIIGATQDNNIINAINNDAPLWVGRAVGSGEWADSLIEFVDAAKASGQPNAVVNLSFDLTQIDSEGVETTRYAFTPAEWEALEYARQNNVMIVAAAGNTGGVMSGLGQASRQFDNIITVGSAQNVDPSVAPAKGFDKADYSNYGKSLDIVANGGTKDNPVVSTSGNDLGTMFGTSVATAQVTGAVSQVWAANPALSYRQVSDILKSTATDLNTPNWDAQTGAGLLNIEAAVFLAKATTPEPYDFEAISTPTLWSGEGEPTERPVNFNYPIKQESFSGWVRPDIGVNLRYSPQFSDRGPRNEPYQQTLYFDAWTWGEAGEDYTIKGRQDALWFRVAGTNYWVPSAYIMGHPPSNPPLLPSNTTTPISGDRLNQLLAKSRLTIDEIREIRQLIAQLPQSNRSLLYRKLQYKVPYFNQRDNGYTSIADVMCNVTTLASCLTFLGVKNPQPSRQFEDVLESILRNKRSTYPSDDGINARYWWSNFAKLAKNEFGIASSGVKTLPGFPVTNLQFFKNFVKTYWEPVLNQGKAIMTGVATTSSGHIVKVIDIDWNRGGIIVDDPYGRAQDRPGNDYKKSGYPGTRNTTSRGSVNTQQGQDEGGIGNDNFWSWSYCAEIFGGNAYLILG
jgi:hypothetical protein